ncbi:MAG: hypothetical protein JXR48_06835 [Candidatus Delongbacteria bacterium]|nr:hypothetical protein [Candidatus Delongbacteria bacterium]MBN2834666.1 hypothetical protein [Candidatus Delongbacteria bacterium]
MKKLISLVLLLLAVVSSYAATNNLLDTASDNFKTIITISVEDKPVNMVLTSLADQADVNLVQSDDTKNKRITADFKDITIKDALDLVVRATDLSYQILDNAILVTSPDKIDRPIGLSSMVYDLQYARAEKVKETLTDITKLVQVDEVGNRIIYQADPKKAKEIERILARIDRPAQQVLFKAKIIEVGMNNDARYGLDWSKLNNYSTTIREGSVVDWGDWTYDDDKNMWEFEYTGTAPVRDISGDHSTKGPIFGRPYGYESNTSSGFNSVWHRVVGQEYLLSLDFQLKDGNANIIAEPSIGTLNNSEAYIHVGDLVPYTVTTIEQGTSKQSVQKEEVGVKLKVKPIINEESDITVAIDAEVSSIYDWRGPNNDIPWIKTRKATTNVRVRDGKPIVIGGMILEDEVNSVNKLPLLGQIPYLGYLFQHHVITKKKTDLLIQITPYIMIDGEVITEDEIDFNNDEFIEE